MPWDILVAAANLDFAGLLGIALLNIFWVFALFCVGFIFFDGKRPLRAFIHVALAPLLMFSLLPFMGMREVGGSFLAFYYVLDFAILKFAETIPFFANRLVWVEEGVFFGSVIIFNLLLS